MSKTKALIIIAVLLGALGAAAYWHTSLQPSIGPGSVASTTAEAATIKPRRTPPAGQSEYYDPGLDFSLFYPSDLKISIDHNGATTISFEDVATVQGFQVYAVGYREGQVTQEQFKKDEPSGVRNDPKDITIGGAVASSFYGYDPRLGDTAEIWFIHNGMLYEVTTLKKDAAWLSQIMQTWEFLRIGDSAS